VKALKGAGSWLPAGELERQSLSKSERAVESLEEREGGRVARNLRL